MDPRTSLIIGQDGPWLEIPGSVAFEYMAPPDDLRPSLVTSFRHVTVVAREGPERTTLDFCVRLSAPDNAQLDKGYVIAETKTAESDGGWDRALADRGCDSISLSKYRIGAGLLHAPDDDRDYACEVRRLFRIGASSR